jgi:hypothetical protein
MDGSRFDAWTRRRFGLTVGGFAASLLALGGLAEIEAKKKKKRKRKKRCKKLRDTCTVGGKRKCCAGLECATTGAAPQTACCRHAGPCTGQADCCQPTHCTGGFGCQTM